MNQALLCALCLWAICASLQALPLDDYVWKADPNYGWSQISSWKGDWLGKGYTGYKVNMTSQQWLTDADFSATSESKSIWWHILLVLVPDEIKYQTNGTLYITGSGMNSVDVEKTEDTKVALSLATSTGVVTGVLYQIPNEHTTFSSDPIQKSRTEDAIIAFTWNHYLNDQSKPEWLVRFPMVKASVRAMDCMAEFVAKVIPEKNLHLDYFTVSGASKRGWTTWLVGAVDPKRVVAIVPIVLDAINFVNVIHHQYRSYNGWSFALQDYIDMNIFQRMDTPEMLSLQQQEDPYFYASRLTMPKLIINAALDEFQQPDDNLYWWSGMPEPKHIMMVPNAEHSLATGILEVVPGVAAWITQLLETKPVPKFDWTIATDGRITATLDSEGEVEEVNAWWAYSCGTNTDTNTKRKDFRVMSVDNPCACGLLYEGQCLNLKSFWTKEKLVEGPGRTYTAHYDPPTDGRYVAYFIEVTYKKHPRLAGSRALESIKDRTERKIADIKKKFEEVKDKVDTAKEIYDALKDVKFPEIPTDLWSRMVFTTQVSVFPQTFPFADCVGDGDATSTCTNKIR